jgi:hypothetical protein
LPPEEFIETLPSRVVLENRLLQKLRWALIEIIDIVTDSKRALEEKAADLMSKREH